MSALRKTLIVMVAVWIACWVTHSRAGQINVGGFFINAEGGFNASASTYAVPITLPAKTRIVVQYAAQYASDFGIIPAADLQKWRNGQSTRFLVRLTGATDTRYVTLNAGTYYAVARDLNGGVVFNGFAMKIRRFRGFAKDGPITKNFVSNKVWADTVGPLNWNGIAFSMPAGYRMWFQAEFSRGADHKVAWEIVTAAQYQKYINGQPYSKLLTGTEPKLVQFEYVAVPATYYFLVKNAAASYSAFTVTRELYK